MIAKSAVCCTVLSFTCLMKSFFFIPVRMRILIYVLLLLVVIFFLFPALKEFNLIQLDYIQFYAAGYQAIRSQDPYQYESTAEVFQKFVNGVPNESFLYPPWLIVLLMPFGLLPIQISRLLWYFLGFGLLLFASDQVWLLYGGPKIVKQTAENISDKGSPNPLFASVMSGTSADSCKVTSSQSHRWRALFLSLTFSPAFFALTLGQLSPFTFAGLVLFVKYMLLSEYQPRKYWLAGMSASLMALKPQSFYLFWVALLIWSVVKREWRVILGAVFTLGAATLLVSFFVPNIFLSFVSTSLKNQPILYCTPTLGYWLREIFGAGNFSLQFVAPILGITWLFGYWKQKGRSWDWFSHLPVLTFISLIASPYAWTHDQVILLLPLLEMMVLLMAKQTRKTTYLILFGWLVTNIIFIVLHFWYPDCWFIWQAPFWLLIYLYLKRNLNSSITENTC